MGRSPTPPLPVSSAASDAPSTPRRLLGNLIYRIPFVESFLLWLVARFQFALLSFYKAPGDVALVRTVMKEKDLLMQPQEAYTLLSLARMQSQLDADLAEVGVYQGASAKLICAVKGSRTFWGFDTFTGLADVSEADQHWGVRFFRDGNYAAEETNVAKYLSEFDGVRLVAGYFPDSAGEASARTFSLVHLDVDTYVSTLASLRFFWPRMVPGGIVITHDSHAAGVAQAASEFIAETGARSFSTTGSQLAFLK